MRDYIDYIRIRDFVEDYIRLHKFISFTRVSRDDKRGLDSLKGLHAGLHRIT